MSVFIFVTHLSEGFCSVTSLEEAFVNVNYCTCSYGVCPDLLLCKVWHLCIYKFKVKYCSVIFLINKNTLLILQGTHLNVMPCCLYLFTNVSYQNVNDFCLRKSD